MDRTLLVLGASYSQIPLFQAARKLGVRTVASTIPGPYAGIPYADEVLYCDITKPEEVLRSVGERRIDGVTTCCMDVGIRALGARPSVSIKPKTPIEAVVPLLPELSMLLVMTVEPGFGGQGFISDTIPKIQALRRIIDENGYDCELECDGGVSAKNIHDVCSYGINVVVAGSAVFGKPDIGAAIAALRAEVNDD